MKKIIFIFLLSILFLNSCYNNTSSNNINNDREFVNGIPVIKPVAHYSLPVGTTEKQVNETNKKSYNFKILKGVDTPDPSLHEIINGNKQIVLNVQTHNSKNDGCDHDSSCYFIANYTYKDPEGTERTYTVSYRLDDEGQDDLGRGDENVFIYNYNPNDHAGYIVVSERLDSAYVFNSSSDRWHCLWVKSNEKTTNDETRYNFFYFDSNIQDDQTSAILPATNLGFLSLINNGWENYLIHSIILVKIML